MMLRSLFILLLSLFCIGTSIAYAHNILIIGDSLSAGYGIHPEDGWANLLQKKLDDSQCEYKVFNDSISGDTTSNGLARLPASLLRYQPAIVMIELGGNDGMRALSPEAMKLNLQKMIQFSKAACAKVLLLAARIPPNYGPNYISKYREVFFDLAKEEEVPLVPKILDNIGGNPALMQRDGIHPNTLAQPIFLDNVWVQLKGLLICPDHNNQ